MAHPLLSEEAQKTPTTKILKEGTISARKFLFGGEPRALTDQDWERVSENIAQVKPKDAAFTQGWFQDVHQSIQDTMSIQEQIPALSAKDETDIKQSASLPTQSEDERVATYIDDPKISIEEHQRILAQAVESARREGIQQGQSESQRNQSRQLIDELQKIIVQISDEQQAESERFTAMSKDAGAAIEAVIVKLIPAMRQTGYVDHVRKAIEDAFSNAMPDLKITMVMHESDKALAERALSAISHEERQRLHLVRGGHHKGRVELRWPESRVLIDWDELAKTLFAKLRIAFDNLSREMGLPQKKEVQAAHKQLKQHTDQSALPQMHKQNMDNSNRPETHSSTKSIENQEQKQKLSEKIKQEIEQKLEQTRKSKLSAKTKDQF